MAGFELPLPKEVSRLEKKLCVAKKDPFYESIQHSIHKSVPSFRKLERKIVPCERRLFKQ
jgi:hypothetical protein